MGLGKASQNARAHCRGGTSRQCPWQMGRDWLCILGPGGMYLLGLGKMGLCPMEKPCQGGLFPRFFPGCTSPE